MLAAGFLEPPLPDRPDGPCLQVLREPNDCCREWPACFFPHPPWPAAHPTTMEGVFPWALLWGLAGRRPPSRPRCGASPVMRVTYGAIKAQASSRTSLGEAWRAIARASLGDGGG